PAPPQQGAGHPPALQQPDGQDEEGKLRERRQRARPRDREDGNGESGGEGRVTPQRPAEKRRGGPGGRPFSIGAGTSPAPTPSENYDFFGVGLAPGPAPPAFLGGRPPSRLRTTTSSLPSTPFLAADPLAAFTSRP